MPQRKAERSGDYKDELAMRAWKGAGRKKNVTGQVSRNYFNSTIRFR